MYSIQIYISIEIKDKHILNIHRNKSIGIYINDIPYSKQIMILLKKKQKQKIEKTVL